MQRWDGASEQCAGVVHLGRWDREMGWGGGNGASEQRAGVVYLGGTCRGHLVGAGVIHRGGSGSMRVVRNQQEWEERQGKDQSSDSQWLWIAARSRAEGLQAWRDYSPHP